MNKFLSVGFMCSSLLAFSSANAFAINGCFDPRTAMVQCVPGAVITSYDCPRGEAHCMALSELPYAEKTTYDGFMAPVPTSRTVKIMRDGKVLSVKTAYPRTPGSKPVVSTSELAPLTAKTLSELEVAVKSNSGKPLPKIDYSKGCQDGPGTSFSIVQDTGTVIQVAAIVNCITYIQDEAGAKLVKDLLN